LEVLLWQVIWEVKLLQMLGQEWGQTLDLVLKKRQSLKCQCQWCSNMLDQMLLSMILECKVKLWVEGLAWSQDRPVVCLFLAPENSQRYLVLDKVVLMQLVHVSRQLMELEQKCLLLCQQGQVNAKYQVPRIRDQVKLVLSSLVH